MAEKMQYNTRRKSISLQALGIQIPQTSKSHRPSISKSSTDMDPPAKRIKREHSTDADTLPLTTSPSTTKTVTFADRPLSSGRGGYEDTPPPSPGETESKIDHASIGDEIVAGVIKQLEKTGNKPHLIKDLATVMSATNADVNRSANPAALLSSRLASYMRRPWSSDNPCLVAKELIPVHPRKVFYYLTTCQRQELPPSALEPLIPAIANRTKNAARVITPSISNASQDDEASNGEERKRAALSPSPEVELGLDMDETMYSMSPSRDGDFSSPINGPTSFIGSTIRRQSSELSGLSGVRTIPMESDEEEFTAAALRDAQRKSTMEEEEAKVKVESVIDLSETQEVKMDHVEDASTLPLGQHALSVQAQKHEAMLLSSPTVQPLVLNRSDSLRDTNLDNSLHRLDDLELYRNPATIGLDELDELLNEY